MTVAIMQPYFIPYAGYFRLFAASDLFVIYDCVQFPRRGWVHRNRLPDASGADRWLTLPLAKAPRDVLIRDLRFTPDAREVLAQRMRSIPLFQPKPVGRGRAEAPPGDAERDIVAAVRDVRDGPVDYIERLLRIVVSELGMKWDVLRSSTLGVPDSLRGQERIIEICRRVGATRYVNSPNGRTLYDAHVFDAAAIELRFLSDYPGPFSSILRRLLEEDAAALGQEIQSSSRAVP